MADTKTNAGLSATGVGTVDCARDNTELLTVVTDPAKFEAYMAIVQCVSFETAVSDIDVTPFHLGCRPRAACPFRSWTNIQWRQPYQR
ncbi:hypothetical protein PAXRUDRAFT_834647 [Paxillus rubicundulus Ve08.2h10]|uniref:Uncharacterized protein n=1 Tax=Paxillus rubicundulus Ve08.2h10 TaxID=930991 RepID=A0A0D0C513_9AGAM|nr:hypothetical protein PAXRUDRAFT_834647 [Paxillus rubicundulus Ve08.2h10]